MRISPPMNRRSEQMPLADSGFVAVPYLPQPEQDSMDLFRKLWRRKGTILLCAGGLGLTALLAALLMTPRYTAESQVMVGIESPNVANIPSVLKDIIVDQDTVQSEGFVVSSRSLAEQVVRRLGLTQDPEFNPGLRKLSGWDRLTSSVKGFVEDDIFTPALVLLGADTPKSAPLSDAERAERTDNIAANILMDKVEVTPLQRSHVLSITAQSQNPALAARIANMLANVYIDTQAIRKTVAAKRATTWLDQQIAELRTAVETSDRAVEDYRRQNGLYETKADMVTSQQVDQLNSQLILAESEKAATEAKLAQAKQATGNTDAIDALPEVVNSPLIQALRQKQVEIQREAAQLSSVYGPEHPKIRDIHAQLNDVKGKLRAQIDNVVTALRNETQSAQARYQSLATSLHRLQGEMGQQSEKSIRLRELQRQADANQQLLRNFLDRSKETSVQQNVTEPDATIISQAVTPLRPGYPPKGLLTLLGILGGAALGVIVVLIGENLDRTFRTRQQVEDATGLSVLAMTPKLRSRRREASDVLARPNSPYSEAIRNLHTRLNISNPAQPPKVVMFTSAAPDEGKSRTATAMARLAAYNGRRVIIVDCDWRRPSQHGFFGQPASPGLAELLSGDATPEQAVYQEPSSGVQSIFAGRTEAIEGDPQWLVRLRMLVGTLAKHYDLVILDAPPVLTGAEALPLARMADGVVFVVKWGVTPRELVLEVLRQLVQVHSKVAGIVLSQVEPKEYRRYGLDNLTYRYRRGQILSVGQ